MSPDIAHIGIFNLMLCVLLVGIAGVSSMIYSLGFERDLLVGTVRTFVQLFLLGYILKVIFELDRGVVVVGVFGFMILFAAWTVISRVKKAPIPLFRSVFLSMLASYMVTAYAVTAFVIDVEPWWKPQYFIPIGGMIIGNSMNAAAIALERLLGELKGRRGEVEMMLCLGADYREASRKMVQNAMRAGMIPSINAMMTVGIVFIPGMMTGQILSGADPLIAIRYQIVVMLMLVGSTSLGTLLIVLLVRKRCFGRGQTLILTR